MAYCSSGVVALIILLYAVTMWVVKLRRIGADSIRLKLSEESERRNDALFGLLNTCVLSELLREVATTTVLVVLPIDPLVAAVSSFEMGLFGIACRMAFAFGTAIAFSIVNIAKEVYGSEEVFNWWIGMLEGPLDLFEQVHIFGKQVASLFYETTESNSATVRAVNDPHKGESQKRL
jgi:hypothetical protein